MRTLLLFSLLLPLEGLAEEFNCSKDKYSSTVLVKASVDKEGGKASIHVAGETHQAIYYVKGFDRNWSFGIDEPVEKLHASGEKSVSFPYLFVIRPDGVSSYYDFTQKKSSDEMVYPKMVFHCWKQKEDGPWNKYKKN